MIKKTDYLVVGSGVAGLAYALKMAHSNPGHEICVITKSEEEESNTKYAQGGIAAVWDYEKDSFEKHIADTLDAGDGLCKPSIVEIVVREGPERIREIIRWGADFDRAEEGGYDLGREGGHSENRVLHHKDLTGWEIERTLLEQLRQQKNITLLTHHFVIDLITQHHMGRIVTRHTPDIACYGVYCMDLKSKKIGKIIAKVTLLASGGGGQVYRTTTNPKVATGDGIAMLYRAKGRIANMEFIQFHPTAFYNPPQSPAFLISEAVRGAGAVLKTQDGKAFMQHYDARESLAPRDIVARAIDKEMKIRGDEFVYLDCRSIPKKKLISHFPNIYHTCREAGIDILNDMIPVAPAAHYFCGGVQVDEFGRTSIQNLYACGECTCSGLHGANRLASNSLLEAVVFAHRVHLATHGLAGKLQHAGHVPDWNAEGTTEPEEMVLITQSHKELQDIMTYYVGIVRSNIRLKRAKLRLELLYKETEELYNSTTLSPQLCELRNLITIGYLITRCASFRKESRGLHYTTDYPEKNPFVEDTIV